MNGKFIYDTPYFAEDADSSNNLSDVCNMIREVHSTNIININVKSLAIDGARIEFTSGSRLLAHGNIKHHHDKLRVNRNGLVYLLVTVDNLTITPADTPTNTSA